MKKIILFCIGIGFSTVVFSQQETSFVKPGDEYGAGVSSGEPLSVDGLEKVLVSESIYIGRMEGKVIAVCQKKGCFMKLEREGDAEPIMVRFKDYGFFMPQNIVGKIVLLEGIAEVKETSVKELQHFAEDVGKASEKIAKITAPKKAVEITAVGVKVVR